MSSPSFLINSNDRDHPETSRSSVSTRMFWISMDHLKRRFVKRALRKILILILVVMLLALCTSVIQNNELKDLEPQPMEGEPIVEASGAKAEELRFIQKREESPRMETPKIEPADLLRRGKPKHFVLPDAEGEKKDWTDYAAMEADKKRVGIGEQGKEAKVEDESQKDWMKKLYRENGFNALLSDMISINRSVPDVRAKGCRSMKYLAKLPKTSVILPFFNEYFSVLMRSIYSIINRTPRELLEEIIIVDDGSDRDYLKQQLDDYIAEHFPNVVRVVRLTERRGLIGARMAGARAARGEVLVFFDSHVECNYNWLPPLIEPIAVNSKVSTCPIIDVVSHETFKYSGEGQKGSRGAFNWNFEYKELQMLPEDKLNETRPNANPIMMGGLFAIHRDFFFELGGYDEGLDIWGAEQYELSFKIWMCGGMLFNIPCSRVAHIFRGPMDQRPNIRKYDFIGRNIKRVVEVWMDEFKKYVYAGYSEAKLKLDPGDLTEQHALRKRLKCKSFKWFLEVVAPDIVEKYPPIPPPDYAYGTIQSLAYPQYCLDSMNAGNRGAPGLFSCAENRTHPHLNQFWALTFWRDLRKHRSELCLDVSETRPNSIILMWHCHGQGGNQFWYYDRSNKWLVHSIYGINCMEAIKRDNKMSVRMNKCKQDNLAMQWEFGYVNNTYLDKFFDNVKDE